LCPGLLKPDKFCGYKVIVLNLMRGKRKDGRWVKDVI
jgi:hypothetical protein